jgi:hypothetical protein
MPHAQLAGLFHPNPEGATGTRRHDQVANQAG